MRVYRIIGVRKYTKAPVCPHSCLRYYEIDKLGIETTIEKGTHTNTDIVAYILDYGREVNDVQH